MNTSRRSLYILFAGIILLLSLAAGSWLFYSKINMESNIIIDASSQIALVQKKESDFDVSKANLQKYGADIQKLRNAFLSESTFVAFLQAMESLAKKAQVEFKAVNASLPTSSSDSAVFSFQLKGGAQELVRFFILLDQVPYSGIVLNVQWTRQGKGGDIITVTGDYQIFNYIK